jgi:hypothetical protein
MPKIARPKRTKAVEKWLREEAKEQKARYKIIEREMNVTIAPQREEWFRAFEQRIQTRGFNVHADMTRKIKPEELYPQPKRKFKVVF